MYAIDDVRDVYGPRITGSWRVLGLDGTDGPFRTDTAPPPADADPHSILTDIRVGSPSESHSRIIKDSTPLDGDSTARMLPLWQWLLHRFSSESSGSSSDPS